MLAQVQADVARTVAATADTRADAWDQLTAGCRAFLTASTDPAVRRIMPVDGPAVLGWSEWRAMDEAGSASHLADTLTALVGAGVIAPQPVQPLVRLLSGAMNEAALWLAESGEPTDLNGVLTALFRMLEALRT